MHLCHDHAPKTKKMKKHISEPVIHWDPLAAGKQISLSAELAAHHLPGMAAKVSIDPKHGKCPPQIQGETRNMKFPASFLCRNWPLCIIILFKVPCQISMKIGNPQVHWLIIINLFLNG